MSDYRCLVAEALLDFCDAPSSRRIFGSQCGFPSSIKDRRTLIKRMFEGAPIG